MNKDEVNFYDDLEEMRKIAYRVDAIIIPSRMDPGRIQELLYSTTKPDVYYYDPDGIELERAFKSDNDDAMVTGELYKRLHSFGADKTILSEKYILHGSLIEKAKEINEARCKEHPDVTRSWEGLSGFEKGAYVNCADYGEIRNTIESWGIFSHDELCDLERIRDSRYACLNHRANEDYCKIS